MSFNQLDYRQLQELAKEQGIQANQTKDALVEALTLAGADPKEIRGRETSRLESTEPAVTKPPPGAVYEGPEAQQESSPSGDWAAPPPPEGTTTYQCPKCMKWKAPPLINPGDECRECQKSPPLSLTGLLATLMSVEKREDVERGIDMLCDLLKQDRPTGNLAEGFTEDDWARAGGRPEE